MKTFTLLFIRPAPSSHQAKASAWPCARASAASRAPSLSPRCPQGPAAGHPGALEGNCKTPSYLIRCRVKHSIPHQTRRNYSEKTWKFIHKAPSPELCPSPAGSSHQSCQVRPKGLNFQSIPLVLYMAKCHCSEPPKHPLIQGCSRLIFPGTTNSANQWQ